MNVFEACRLLDVRRVVYCSSRSIYKQEPQGEIPETITEDYPKAPGHLYAASKVYMEHLAEEYNASYGLECIGMRFAETFGPGKVKYGSRQGVGQMIENAMSGTVTRIAKGGEQRDEYIYYRDIAAALVSACLVKSLRHRIFNIGTGTAVSLFEVAKAIKRAFPSAQIDIGPGLDFSGTGV